MSDDAKSAKPNRGKGKGASALLQVIIVAFLVGTGWVLRGLMPGGAPAGGPPGPMGMEAGTPAVEIAVVREASAAPAREFVGHVRSVQTVDLRAQVPGYIDEVHFQEGSLVEEGDMLFTVERAPYEAKVALAEASLGQAEANLAGAHADVDAALAAVGAAKSELDRASKYLNRLENADKRSVVQADLDAARNAVQQAEAKRSQASAQLALGKSQVTQRESMVKQAAASLDLARIDLGYTEIESPITGRIGLIEVTKGNYVSPSTPRLARIVQVDPIRVVFAMSDRAYVDSLQAKAEHGGQAYSVRLRLPNGTDYPGVGQMDFADNEMSRETGAIANYGSFDNPDGLLIAGSYVTVSLEDTAAPRLPVVPQEAIMLDAEGAAVYVVNAEGKAELRRVELGPVAKGLQYVSSGLSAGENVVAQGLQKVTPGAEVVINEPTREEGANP